jgi:hypothetical protein
MTCNVCCSDYNKSNHSVVTCYFPSCSYSACKECTRTYLTGITAEPHCMKCRNKWSLEFTKNSLNAIFMDNDYKNHRKTILADRAISKIPEFYEGALRHAKISEGDLKMQAILKIVAEHQQIINDLYRQHDQIRREMNETPASAAARKFVMQCQNNGCRGMLTQQYKCDLCTKFTCPKCFLAIDGEKADHVCKQEDIDTVEELKKNSRPCPSCGTRISKIDGCDQMWCPECKTAFSWAKGTVETGVIHNPHYYQWMRENGGVPRNPNEHNEGCGNIFYGASRKINSIIFECLTSKKLYGRFCESFETNAASLSTHSKFATFEQIYKDSVIALEETKMTYEELRRFNHYFSGFHRYINHMELAEMRPLRQNLQVREEDRTVIYNYILNHVNKEALANELIRIDNLNMKERAYCDILEALVVVGKQIMIDCLRELENEVNQNFPNSIVFNINVDPDKKKRDERPDTELGFLKNFVKNCVVFLPCELARFHSNICGIFAKYKTAINKYCAYSNMESIKFLITYASKKSLSFWDYNEQTLVRRSFRNKSEMVAAIAEFREFYDMCNKTDAPEVVENKFV